MIHRISLAECLEPVAPPGRVLDISVLDDVAFVRVSDVEQGSRHETHTDAVEISVSLPSLLEALHLLANDAGREHLRPVGHDGKSMETRIAGRRLTVAPTGPVSAVAATTAHTRYTPMPGTKLPPLGRGDAETKEGEGR